MNLSSSFFEVPRQAFLPLTKRFSSEDLKKTLRDSDINLSVPEYLSLSVFFSIIVFIIALIAGLAVLAFLGAIATEFTLIALALTAFLASLIILIVYPYYAVMKKINSIKANLPLAILSMATVGESGVPPQYMFESIAKEQTEFPYISKELSKIPRLVEDLGVGFGDALDILAKTTVSHDIKKFLGELKATLESGGDLTLYMIKRAEQAEFEYSLKLDEANKRAELFGDIYTAVVIAAPLFIFSAVMLIGLFGGTFAQDINFYMNLGIFALIPGVNIVFLVIMEVLSPTSG